MFSTLLVYLAIPQVLFVSPSGSNSNPGTQPRPLATVQFAVDRLRPGDTAVVMPGVYRESVRVNLKGTNRLPISIRAAEPGAIFSGTDPVLGWMQAESGVFQATAKSNFSEGGQAEQLFQNGLPLNELRWPKNTGTLASPSDAQVLEAKDAGGNLIEVKVGPTWTEPDHRWVGAKVWFNLSHLGDKWGHDGQAGTGTVTATSLAKGTITISGLDKRSWNNGVYDPEQPWGIGKGNELYLYRPTAEGLRRTGGIAKALGPNEWWRDVDSATYFVRPRDGKTTGIEARRRSFALDLSGSSYVTVDGFDLFATSITTDNEHDSRTDSVAPSRNITLRNLQGRYLTHFTEHAGQYQMQWVQRSGIRLSGENHLLENSVFEDVAGAAISVIGRRNRVLGNTIRRANYSVSEAGCIDTGRAFDPKPTTSFDHEIGFNTIEDSPQQGINIRGLVNSDPSKPGLARVHHNLIRRVMQRSYDSAAVDQFGIDGQWVRIDHNVIHDLVGSLRIGIYIDFGYGYLIDHNVLWNVDRPIQVNHNDAKKPNRVRVEWNTAISAKQQFQMPGIMNGAGNTNPDSTFLNNITSVRAELGSGTQIAGNVIAQDNLFVNPVNFDFRPTSALNAGAYAYGVERWDAGADAYRNSRERKG